MKNPIDFLRSRGHDDNVDNTNTDDDIKCERLVKNYDGKSIEIAGLNFGGSFQLGKFGIEPKLLQTVSHALMLLDESQYDLCMSVKNMQDKEDREKYVKLMTDDKLAAQRIYRALAGLLINPQSTQMQDTVKETLLSSLAYSQSRVANIENSNLLSKVQQQQQPPSPPPLTLDQTTITKSPIEIETTSFKEKINDLKQSYHQINNISKQKDIEQSSTSSPPTTAPSQTITTTMNQEDNKTLPKELAGVRNAIFVLNDEYTTGLIDGLNVVEFWKKLGGVLKELTANQQYRKLLGTINAGALDRIIIKIAEKVNEFKEADDIGNTKEASIAKKEVILYFGQAFRKMDDIYYSIQQMKS